MYGCVRVEQTTEWSEKLLASLEPPQVKLTESGCANANADALSQNPSSVNAICAVEEAVNTDQSAVTLNIEGV